MRLSSATPVLALLLVLCVQPAFAQEDNPASEQVSESDTRKLIQTMNDKGGTGVQLALDLTRD